jgi:hypothetical protein
MKKLPFRATLLLLLVLTFVAWNALRLWTALAWRDVLNEFSAQPTPMTAAVSGAIWMISGIILAWGVSQKKRWATKALFGVAAGYTVWYWSERFVWQNPHPNWQFAVVVNLALVVFILFATKPRSKEAYEQNIENQKTK